MSGINNESHQFAYVREHGYETPEEKKTNSEFLSHFEPHNICLETARGDGNAAVWAGRNKYKSTDPGKNRKAKASVPGATGRSRSDQENFLIALPKFEEDEVGFLYVKSLGNFAKDARTACRMIEYLHEKNINTVIMGGNLKDFEVKTEIAKDSVEFKMLKMSADAQSEIASEKSTVSARTLTKSGKRVGRKPETTDKQLKLVYDLLDAGVSQKEIAKKLNFSQPKVSRLHNLRENQQPKKYEQKKRYDTSTFAWIESPEHRNAIYPSDETSSEMISDADAQSFNM